VASGYLQYDFCADVAIDRLMLFGLAGAPVGTTLRVSSSTAAQGATYASQTATVALYAGANRLVNGKGVAYLPLPVTTARYVRVELFTLANAVIDIGRVVLGKALILQRNFQFGAAFGVRDFSNVEFSARANLLRRKAKKLRTVGLSFPSSYRDEIEAQISPMLETVGIEGAIALITDPAADPMRERRCSFGLMTGDLGSVWRTAKAWEWRSDLVSLF
jgi:hypothetical protein